MKSKCIKLSFFSFILWFSSPILLAQPSRVDNVINKLVQPFIETHQTPGLAIAIYYNGKDYYYNFGFADRKSRKPVTKNTIFELASITKIFISTLVALEVQKGKWNVTDYAVEYTPELSKTKGLPIDRVQIVNLATHTASFPKQMEQFGVNKGNIQGFFTRLKTWRPPVKIGTHYKYSNIGFGYLGYVLENATNETLPNLLKSNITKPLGMSHTFFDVPETLSHYEAQGYRPKNKPAPYYIPANFLGGGALRSSSADMLTFLKANLGIQLGTASAELLSAMQYAQQPFFVVNPNFVMGLGWQRVKRGRHIVITKNGANQGFSTFIGFSPAKKLGVVVLINQARGKATLLGNQILNSLLGL
ncbi:TPA: serine hydrolase [Legionella pneumophila]|uniref:Serine hydrolase n=1 Tax=Legionella pneumophila TaxID=446 RepID=A0A2S6EXE1_LEGPN|nr:serine hydrolase [Legionella pneumophila]APF04066.1 class C beta-lactamase [Legionella pneumophila subsp. fraseri]APF07049.1 class C beta-lactamase [Legionella pneumophila subsp. fraseri]AUB69506.1 class C beta-lactamase [Legionella pneumophila]AUB72478.1 class C beta-lactamase [Legionella pneumophila]KXB25485.1 beta-lactamase [Legionella pneumophila]